MVIETLTTLRIAAGLVGVGYSLYGNQDTEGNFKFGEVPTAIFGQVIGGIFNDYLNEGKAKAYEKFQKKYTSIAFDKNSLNHDLIKAARKAQLIATFFAAQDCLEKVKAANLPDDERGQLKRTYDKAKTFIQGKDSRQVFFEAVIKYINEQIKNLDDANYSGNFSFEEFNSVFDIYSQAVQSTDKQKISDEFKSDIIKEFEIYAIIEKDFKLDADGFNKLKTAINDGWNEMPKTDALSEHFVSLSIIDTPQSKIGAKFDWFNLVCVIFNEEYKENPKVEAAAQKQVLLEILGKLDKFGKLKNKTVKNLTAQISAFADDLKYIKDGIDELKVGQKRIEETLTQIIAPEKEGVELALVSLPDLKGNIYGRDDEIKEILKFLANEQKHGAIVLPTCFGKTSLIRKFLQNTTANNAVNAEHHGVFEKVVYIFCYQNQGFQQIIKPFESLMGKRLEDTKGDKTGFLKEKVFDQLQHQKILLILDNFESWIDENDKYLNDDVRVFLETLLGSNHQIRTLFVSQRLPHKEKDFRTKVDEIKAIEQALLKGLDEKSALELVRTEGDEEDFKYVTDDDLRDFCKKVFYIPQAIQSMLWFIDYEAISFDELMTKGWMNFEKAETDLTDIEKQIPKELRPTRAMLIHQLRNLDANAAHLLCLSAFFDTIIPEEILLADFGNYQKTELRKPLDRLAKHKLILTETDEQAETDEQTGTKSVIRYYQLHGFVHDVINEMFPNFAVQNNKYLQMLANQMEYMCRKAWEKKLFDKLLALVECWEILETEIYVNQKMLYRKYFFDRIDGVKALALQNKIFNITKHINPDEIKKQTDFIESIYINSLKKYPNDIIVFNNLGTLLARDDTRWTEAVIIFKKLIKFKPNNANAYNNLGLLLGRDKKRWAEAEENFKKAIELNPNDAMVYHNLGNLLAKDESRWREAEEKFERAIELNPNDANAYTNLGVLLAKDESRWREAEEKYERAIELNPHYANAYYNLACLRSVSRKEENKDAVFKFLRKTIELDSKFKEIAKTDADFDFVRDDERFKLIVND